MNQEDARRKVRALRATAAPGSGATDPERATAARLADKLTRENGLDRLAPARNRYGDFFTVTFTAGGCTFTEA